MREAYCWLVLERKKKAGNNAFTFHVYAVKYSLLKFQDGIPGIIAFIYDVVHANDYLRMRKVYHKGYVPFFSVITTCKGNAGNAEARSFTLAKHMTLKLFFGGTKLLKFLATKKTRATPH